MTRLPSIGVTNISTTYYLLKCPANNALKYQKSHGQTPFYNDKATIHWRKKNLDNRLPSIMTKLPSIVVTKISKTDYLP